MKNKTFTATLLIVSIVVIAGFTAFKLAYTNKRIKNSLPYLTQGEKIKYFDLISVDDERIDSSIFESNRPQLIFIFSRPCSPCNKNIIYWKKMAEILKDKVYVYGIILDDVNEAFSFSKNARLNFNIYAPENLNEFIKKLRIKLNFSQTIVYYKNVKFVKLGDMESEEAVNIIKLAKGLV